MFFGELIVRAALDGGAIHDIVVDRSAVTREASEVSPVGNHLIQIPKAAALEGGAIHDNATNIIQLGQKVPGASRLL